MKTLNYIALFIFTAITALAQTGVALRSSNNLNDVQSASSSRANLGLAIGTNVQAWSANLDSWSAKTPFSGVLAITSGKTLTATNTLTLSGTDGTVMTYPTTSATIARTDAANTFTGASTTTSWSENTPVIAGGLTASGSGSNDFSGSTGTFKTSSGANTLSGAVTIADATTPSLTTASGKTNTGFIQINGKTSGATKFTTADATAQTVTISTAAQTVGAATLTIPNLAGTNKSVMVTGDSYPTTLLNYTYAADTIQSVSATTWTTLVSDQSFTVTNASAPIEVLVQACVTQFDDSVSAGTDISCAMRIQIDGATTPANYQISAAEKEADLTNNDRNNLTGGSITIGTLSAGTHTIRVQVWSNVALNTGNASFYLRTIANSPFEFLQMQVIQRN